MAENDAKAGLDALVKSLVASIEATGATEHAIHAQTQAVLGATTEVITDLVKTNIYDPELAKQGLKVHKAVIDRTIEAIQDVAPPDGPARKTTGTRKPD